jgi:hypothetical protein
MRICLINAVGCCLVIGSVVCGGIEGPITNLNASDAESNDQYGISVAIDGVLALIGSHNDNDMGVNSGSAYVYDLTNPAMPIERDKMSASDGGPSEIFGWSVSIDGTMAVIGAFNDQDNGMGAGSAYVFDLSTAGSPVELGKLLASDGAANDNYGYSVAISGSIALVGAPKAGGTGQVYVIDLSTPGLPVEASIITASDAAASDEFGWVVHLDGTLAVVGAHRDDGVGIDSGSVYLFDLSDPYNPVEKSKVVASDTAQFARFGNSAEISGALLLVAAIADSEVSPAAGAAYVFDVSDPVNPVERAKLLASDAANADRFGSDVSISGSIGLVGARSDDDKGESSGSAYTFDLADPANPNELSKFIASNGEIAAFMGDTVAVSGSLAVTGAFQSSAAGGLAGSAYVFDSVDDGVGCAGDGNGDGVIDVNDISYVLFRLGTVCP